MVVTAPPRGHPHTLQLVATELKLMPAPAEPPCFMQSFSIHRFRRLQGLHETSQGRCRICPIFIPPQLAAIKWFLHKKIRRCMPRGDSFRSADFVRKLFLLSGERSFRITINHSSFSFSLFNIFSLMEVRCLYGKLRGFDPEILRYLGS